VEDGCPSIIVKTVVDQFTKRAETYSRSANWISDSALIQAHLDACGKTPPGNALEVCCGTGMVGRAFQKAGWSVCGIDLTRGMAIEANRYFPCICSPAENIPFLDESFDVVLLRQAYFLIPDGQRVLEEVRRVLRPDGVFVFSQTVPYGKEDEAWLEKIHRTKQSELRHFYTEGSLASELHSALFRVDDVRRLSVRENISRWMASAPELSEQKRAEVCGMIANAPEAYRALHRVELAGGEIFEDWNWVIFRALKRQP
jgi:DNA gyrase subunit B